MSSSHAIGRHFEDFIERMLRSGRYANASEVLRAGLRLLDEYENERLRQRAEAMTKIDEGLRSIEEGRTIPAEEVFAELREMVVRGATRDAAE